MMSSIYKYFSIFIFLFLVTSKNSLAASYENKELISCNNLSYEKSLSLEPSKFASIEIELIIKEQRKWTKNILKNIVSIQKFGHNLNRKKIKVDLIITNNNNVKCKLKAEVRGHGDMMDHYADDNKGYRFIYNVPSLRVRLLEGHIFGITKFILFQPSTRSFNNEVLVTSVFEQLKFLAPRTSKVSIKYNNQKYFFLFQESIVKEFLENNSLIEGPIFEGDERFEFNGIYDEDIGISKHRLSNKKWSKLSKYNMLTAKEGLQILNLTNYFYSSDINQYLSVDYFTSQQDKIFNSYFLKLPAFDALNYSMGSIHGLSRDDRRFYYDINKKLFIPIYYDGSGDILSKENQIKSYNRVPDSIINSAYQGSTDVIKLLEKLDISKLTETLNKRGLLLNLDEVNEIINKMKNRLAAIKQTPNKQISKSTDRIQYRLNDINMHNKLNILDLQINYLFENMSDKKFQNCDLALKKCKIIELNLDQQADALSQKLNDKNGNQLIYLGNYKNYKKNNNINEINTPLYLQRDEKIINLDNGTNLIIYGNIIYQIDYEKKIILLIKNNFHDTSLFTNGLLKDWQIEFKDNSTINKKNNKENEETILHNYGKVGCLNFHDIELNNVKIKTQNTKCEDAIHILRGKGKKLEFEIYSAISDGLDSDFSNLEIKKILIEKAGNDCLDLSYGFYEVNNLTANYCQDKAISVGENSTLIIKDIDISNSTLGIASKDYSKIIATRGTIKNTQTCMSAYSKKQEFSGAAIQFSKIECENSTINTYIDQYSIIEEINDI